MKRASWLALTLLAAAVLLASCGGAHTANVQVGVSNEQGNPLAHAEVWIAGTSQRVSTNSTGNATLKGVNPGVYQLEAGTNGYFRQHRSLTVSSSSQPSPVSISLPYAPPLGTWVWQPKSTMWIVLRIRSYNPWNAVVNDYEWGCFTDGWESHQPQQVGFDPKTNQLTFDTYTIQIVRPEKLNSAWQHSVDGSYLPDFTSNTMPIGACNGSNAAWDSGNAPTLP